MCAYVQAMVIKLEKFLVMFGKFLLLSEAATLKSTKSVLQTFGDFEKVSFNLVLFIYTPTPPRNFTVTSHFPQKELSNFMKSFLQKFLALSALVLKGK